MNLKLISRLLALVILWAASWALYRELRNYGWREFRNSLQEISSSRVGWAVLLAGLDYTILVGSDWLASRIVGRRVPLAGLAMGSVAGYAASHNLGAVFGGTPVRYRFYSSWGVPPPEIAIWIAMLSLSFAGGASTVGGIACLVHPTATSENIPWLPVNPRWLGAVLVALPVCYVISCARFRSPLHIRKWTIHLPPPRLAVLQVAVGSADLCCAAGILYVLLPADAAIGYPAFVTVYLLAIVAAVCSHVPGGVGVFDLLMIKMLDAGDPHDVLAAILVYRAIFYLLPLAVGVVFFALHEVQMRRASG
ncbi:MAG TPA: lysylphosphatidylglycerol synthase domain-containing protein [Pirellulales bacterium]|nr:lysylphosphatidylglycerol synthase domain-containing protein [Pirellulales bacterium]